MTATTSDIDNAPDAKHLLEKAGLAGRDASAWLAAQP